MGPRNIIVPAIIFAMTRDGATRAYRRACRLRRAVPPGNVSRSRGRRGGQSPVRHLVAKHQQARLIAVTEYRSSTTSAPRWLWRTPSRSARVPAPGRLPTRTRAARHSDRTCRARLPNVTAPRATVARLATCESLRTFLSWVRLPDRSRPRDPIVENATPTNGYSEHRCEVLRPAIGSAALVWKRWWWALTGSNRRPTRCKRAALPAELSARRLRDALDGVYGGAGGFAIPCAERGGRRRR